MCSNKKELSQLQFLRFIAFLNVFLQHCSGYQFFDLTYNAAWAVSFFFILSGFLFGYRNENFSRSIDFKEWFLFIKRRISKFYPLFFITTVVAIPLSSLLEDMNNMNYSSILNNFVQLIVNILFLQSFRNKGYFSYNGVTWFLSVQIFLYLITPALIIFFKKKSNIFLGFSGLLLIVLGFIWGAICNEYCSDYYIYVFPLARMPEYILGIITGFLFFKVKANEKLDFKSNYIIFSFIEVSIFIGIQLLFHIDVPNWLNLSSLWMIPNIFLIFVFAIGRGAVSKTFHNKCLIYLGNISMECYLIHELVIRYYALIGTATNKVSAAVSWFLIMGITLCISIFVHNENLSRRKQRSEKLAT